MEGSESRCALEQRSSHAERDVAGEMRSSGYEGMSRRRLLSHTRSSAPRDSQLICMITLMKSGSCVRRAILREERSTRASAALIQRRRAE